MSANGRSRAFDDPIPLPDGNELRTFRDPGSTSQACRKDSTNSSEWIAATEALMLVIEYGGDPMLPRIAIMQALNTGKAKPASPPRRKAAKRYRVVR